MRRGLFFVLIALAAVAGVAFLNDAHGLSRPALSSAAASRPCTSCQASVYFSPNGGCATAIIRAIRAAKSSVLVQAYNFTYEPIANALVEAGRRGVNVQVILDKAAPEEKHSVAKYLSRYGVTVLIDGRHDKAHNKVMIIDEQTVITGSYNLIRDSEENNAENLVFLDGAELAKTYADNWRTHAGHSVEFAPSR